MIQTTSREISSELGSLLVENRYEYGNTFWIENDSGKIVTLNGVDYSKGYHVVFTMSELWDMLPKEITYMQMQHVLFICSTPHYTFVDYAFGGWDGLNVIDNGINIKEENPCNALAKLVIWCIENNHPLNLSKL